MANTNFSRKSFHPAKPLTRDHMPYDFSISLDKYTSDHTVRIPSDFGPIQALSGFDPSYKNIVDYICLLYTSPSPRDRTRSRMPSSA